MAKMDQVQQLALRLALEELMHWPELPGITYYVKFPEEDAPRAVQARDVKHLYEALYKHVNTLYPMAESIRAKADEYDRLAQAMRRLVR